MAREKSNKWYGYWKTLKQGYDYFEKYRIPPSIAVCERRYVVDAVARSRPDPAGHCPAFDRPVVTAFTPLPEPAEMDVASGNKLKGIANPDDRADACRYQGGEAAAKRGNRVDGRFVACRERELMLRRVGVR